MKTERIVEKVKVISVNENVFDQKYREKSLAFFDLISKEKFRDAYYVINNKGEENTFSITTLKNGKPMSLPESKFYQALGLNQKSVSNKDLEDIFGKTLIVISKSDFFKRVRKEIIKIERRRFWKKFKKIHDVTSIIESLQKGEEIIVEVVHRGDELIPKSSLRIEENSFCLNTGGVIKEITATEALDYIVSYIKRQTHKKDDSLREFIVNTFMS
ncbi:hypothetical protein PBI_PBS1_180 [Bacillus phage PBS1]|uniref:Uncharacterized protein n=1 Tax=Bacillus phage PBS1 TaxID=2884423 RepID=A0A223LEQ6_BPPB1|nr:hypothetical protein FK780_gp267 [Bacillus phage PBS1]ASU00002.1 hypothetical protein PBI_PBS1_180 [Bacillus phage PBS1]